MRPMEPRARRRTLGRSRRPTIRREAPMKRLLVLTAAVGGLAFALTASAAPTNATLVIRHQLRGCHTWSLNGGAFKASQAVRVAKGGSIVVTNNDVMFHKLVKLSGPSVTFTLVKTGSAM